MSRGLTGLWLFFLGISTILWGISFILWGNWFPLAAKYNDPGVIGVYTVVVGAGLVVGGAVVLYQEGRD